MNDASNLILIVEDEKDLVTTLEYNLKQEGYRTQYALTGEDGLRMARGDPKPHLIVLDLMLPGISGIEVCRRLREDPLTRTMPIIILTARGEEIDKVVGFEAGADDYLVKPFKIRELILRIRAVLRRAHCADHFDRHKEIVFGPLKVDMDGHRVWVNEEEISLTAIEFRMLSTFLTHKGQVQSRDSLLNAVWGMNAFVIQTRTVDAHVKRLREKLGSIGRFIETIRGVGYRFKRDPE
ncbi:response regulator [Magnetococcales bacterium HHB-1]